MLVRFDDTGLPFVSDMHVKNHKLLPDWTNNSKATGQENFYFVASIKTEAKEEEKNQTANGTDPKNST